MKKTYFYLWAMMMVAMLCIGFTSCGDDDDDDDGPVTGTGLVGTWQFTTVENHYYNGDVETIDYTPYEGIYELYMQFNANGKGTTYEKEGDKKWYIWGPYPYTFDGKTISGMGEGGLDTEVLSLTDSELVIKATEDLDDEDVEYMIQTYKRVSNDKVKDAK